jgi:hypothetical protein
MLQAMVCGVWVIEQWTLLLLQLPAADRNSGKMWTWWTGIEWSPSGSEVSETSQTWLLKQRQKEAAALM